MFDFFLKVSNSSEDHGFNDRFYGEANNEPIMPEINGQTELLSLDVIQNVNIPISSKKTLFCLEEFQFIS